MLGKATSVSNLLLLCAALYSHIRVIVVFRIMQFVQLYMMQKSSYILLTKVDKVLIILYPITLCTKQLTKILE